VTAVSLHSRVRLIPTARIVTDKVTGRPVLHYPEGVLWLNETGSKILSLCHQAIAVSSIVETLAEEYSPEERVAIEKDVIEFLDPLVAMVLVRVEAIS
jgi:coenzyme PQQ biosynthesis protein PqqD